jgi:hypothetical protein
MNPAGAIAGFYVDAQRVAHGYVRAPDGAITTFDVPGAGATPGSFQGTLSAAINSDGAITGAYVDAGDVYHGFLRAANGAITKFDVPGATQGTVPGSINPVGSIVGYYTDAMGANHGFLRTSDGNFTTIDGPGAGKGPDQGTFPNSNNPAGSITGEYLDGNSMRHGFLWKPND